MEQSESTLSDDCRSSMRVRFFITLLSFANCGCPSTGLGMRGEPDSWAHYAGGGVFDGGSPSISPDGATLVYASPRSGHGDIYAITIDDSTTSRLTNDPGFEAWPVFSPDGTRIALAREIDHRRTLWIMNADGTGQVQLTEGSWDCPLGFSGDGERLFAIRLNPDRTKPSDSRTISVNVITGDIRTIALRQCSVSPDGSTLLYTEQDAAGINGIWAMNFDGTGVRRIGNGWSPSFSADGSKIAHIGPNLQPKEVWRMDADGRNKEKVSIPSGYVISGPRFCRDGAAIVLLSTDDDRGVGNIYVVDIATGAAPCITSTK